MDQPFESDVMEDLAANSSFGDEGAFDAWDGMEGEGFEGFEAEDSFGEEQLGLEYLGGEGFLGGDEYEAELGEDFGDDYFIDSEANDWDALEEAVADALDAEDSDEFFRQLLGGISRVAGRVDSFKLSTADFESINLTEDSQVYLSLTKRVSHNN